MHYFVPIYGRVAHSMAMAPARHSAVEAQEHYHSNSNYTSKAPWQGKLYSHEECGSIENVP